MNHIDTESFAEFAKTEIAPYAADWDLADYCPVEIFPKLGKAGILGIFVPEKYGGAGAGHTERVTALEEIARYSAGLAMFVFTHQLGMATLLEYGTDEQKEKYLPELCAGTKISGLATTEPGGGSDLIGAKTYGTLAGGQWTLNGRKCFITNSHIADVCMLTAKSGEDEKGRAQLSIFLVEKDTPGFRPGHAEKKLGLKGSVTGELVLTDVKIPEENVIGAVGKGYMIASKTIGEVGRASMAAIGTGLVRACLEESVKFANSRIVYGKPIAKLQAIQFIVAENRIDYEAAKLLLYRAAAMKDAGENAVTEFSIAKYFAVDAAVKAARRTIELMGAYGIIEEYPVQRFMRDALAAISSGGTSEIQKLIIAGDTLKSFANNDTNQTTTQVERKKEQLTGTTEEIAARIANELKRIAPAQTPATITDARIVIGGGAGVANTETWQTLTNIAQKLGAAVGYTRPVVDAGITADSSNMIGTSGKTIAPDIYLCFGISGNQHHTAGIANAKQIISVNSNPNAEIFAQSDFYAVCDAGEILNAIIKLLL